MDTNIPATVSFSKSCHCNSFELVFTGSTGFQYASMEKFSLLLPALHIFYSKQGPLVVRAKTQQSLANDMELNYPCGRSVTLTVSVTAIQVFRILFWPCLWILILRLQTNVEPGEKRRGILEHRSIFLGL